MLRSAAILLALVQTAENPEYRSWASFQGGAVARYRQSGVQSGETIEAEFTYTLIELTRRKAILGQTLVRRAATGCVESFFARIEIPAGPPASRQPLREGSEEILVDGRRLRCRWAETDEGPGLRMKQWLCDEVPGGLVRREVEAEGERPARTILELISWRGRLRLPD